MAIKSVSQRGLNFLIKEEGIVLKPYLCSAKTATIGVGCTFYEDGKKVSISDPAITKARAIALFKHVLRGFEARVSQLVRSNINQNQFDALVSLCFNIGVGAFSSSTLLKKVNIDPTDASIESAFKAWQFASGKPILAGRRTREYRLFLNGHNNA